MVRISDSNWVERKRKGKAISNWLRQTIRSCFESLFLTACLLPNLREHFWAKSFQSARLETFFLQKSSICCISKRESTKQCIFSKIRTRRCWNTSKKKLPLEERRKLFDSNTGNKLSASNNMGLSSSFDSIVEYMESFPLPISSVWAGKQGEGKNQQDFWRCWSKPSRCWSKHWRCWSKHNLSFFSQIVSAMVSPIFFLCCFLKQKGKRKVEGKEEILRAN